MSLVRSMSVLAFALLSMTLGCSGGGLGTPATGEGAGEPRGAAPAGAKSGGSYGFEFLTDTLTPAGGPAPVSEGAASANTGGRLAPETIRDVVRAGMRPMAACYKEARESRSAREGEIAVRFLVREDGSVVEARKERATIEDEALIACVTSAVSALRFPTSGGGTAEVVYPMRFAEGPLPETALKRQP